MNIYPINITSKNMTDVLTNNNAKYINPEAKNPIKTNFLLPNLSASIPHTVVPIATKRLGIIVTKPRMKYESTSNIFSNQIGAYGENIAVEKPRKKIPTKISISFLSK